MKHSTMYVAPRFWTELEDLLDPLLVHRLWPAFEAKIPTY